MTDDEKNGQVTSTTLGKEETIASLLTSGLKPTELLKKGYSKGTVYKVAKKMDTSSNSKTGTSSTMEDVDLLIESDPEILELKKKIRKAELENELANLKVPVDLDKRLEAIESDDGKLWEALGGGDRLDQLEQQIGTILGILDDTPLKGLRSRFKCNDCGVKAYLAVHVKCTVCDEETYWGWYPKKQ